MNTIVKKGVFYLIDSKEAIPGTVTITEGQDIFLEVHGVFHEGISPPKNFDILGVLEDYSHITLQNSIYLRKSISNMIPTASLRSDRAILDQHILRDNIPLFNEISFSTTQLIEWLGLSAINVEFNDPSCLINIDIIEPIEHQINDTEKICIYFGTSGPSKPVGSTLQVTQTAYICYVCANAMSIDDLYKKAYCIRDFISLGIDQCISMSDVVVSSPDTYDSHILYHGLRVFQKDLNFQYLLEKKSKKIDMLFTYHCIRDRFESILKNWINIYCQHIDPIELYFSIVAHNFNELEKDFLHYAQGLESLYREVHSEDSYIPTEEFDALVETLVNSCPEKHRDWLKSKIKFANTITFRDLIKDLINNRSYDFFGNAKCRKKLSENITSCRNVLTHKGKNSIQDHLQGQNIKDLRACTGLIFKIFLMTLSGIPEKDIKKFILRNDACMFILKNSLPLQ